MGSSLPRAQLEKMEREDLAKFHHGGHHTTPHTNTHLQFKHLFQGYSPHKKFRTKIRKYKGLWIETTKFCLQTVKPQIDNTYPSFNLYLLIFNFHYEIMVVKKLECQKLANFYCRWHNFRVTPCKRFFLFTCFKSSFITIRYFSKTLWYIRLSRSKSGRDLDVIFGIRRTGKSGSSRSRMKKSGRVWPPECRPLNFIHDLPRISSRLAHFKFNRRRVDQPNVKSFFSCYNSWNLHN